MIGEGVAETGEDEVEEGDPTGEPEGDSLCLRLSTFGDFVELELAGSLDLLSVFFLLLAASESVYLRPSSGIAIMST